MSNDYIDQVAPEHERTSCSDDNLYNMLLDPKENMRCLRCTLLMAARSSVDQQNFSLGELLTVTQLNMKASLTQVASTRVITENEAAAVGQLTLDLDNLKVEVTRRLLKTDMQQKKIGRLVRMTETRVSQIKIRY